MKRKNRRKGLSFGTVFMLLLTALVIAACVLFLTMIAGSDLYERTGEFIRTLSEQGMYMQRDLSKPTETPRRTMTFIDEETPTPVPVATATPVPQRTTMTLVAGGAIYAPNAIRQSAQSGRQFDFTAMFEGIGSVMREADLAIATLETTTAGESHGYGNYNTPPQILDALRASGVDLLSLATEHALDKGYAGLDLTLSELTTRGLASAGVYPDGEKGKATMMRIGGIQVAVLAYTYGMSDTGMEKTQRDARGVVSMLDTNAMLHDIRQARVDGANLVIVLPHWGTKNKSDTADTIRILARQMAEAGADVILGTHPNVVQGTERMRVTRSDGISYDAVVCYSLGCLMTDARTEENTAGMLAKIDVTHDPVTRRVKLGGLECVPVYIARQREENKTVYRAVNTQDETAMTVLTGEERSRAEQAANRVDQAAGMLNAGGKQADESAEKENAAYAGGHG